MYIATMAWRNIWRNPRRTLVTMAAMTIAAFTMICFSVLATGFIQKMESDVLDVEVGDIQIFTADYQVKPSLYSLIETPQQLQEKLQEKGYRTSARLLGGALAASQESSAGAALKGISITEDATVSKIAGRVIQGEWIDESDPQGVVIGRQLARTLAVTLGDEVILLSQATDGSMANALYRVRGIIAGVGDGTDRSGIFMTEQAFRDFYGLDSGAHQLIIRRPTETTLEQAERNVNNIAQQFNDQQPQESHLDVKSWRTLLPTIATMIESGQQTVKILFFVVYIAVGLLILNATLMAVFERVREIGVLKAIGLDPGHVVGMILFECLIQVLLAAIMALLLSIPAVDYLVNTGINMSGSNGISVAGIKFDEVWYGVVTADSYSSPIITLILMVTIGTLYPAIKAARITPVSAIRHQ